MYIAFSLAHPIGARPVSRIVEALDHWCNKYQVDGYQTKIVRNCMRVTFDNDSLYHVFALTWQPGNQDPVFQFSLIEPMKTRQV